MKYPAHIYAKALAGAITAPGARAEAIAKNFMALLAKNGDEGHAKKILEEAARFARGQEGIHKIVLESARPLTAKQKKELTQFVKPSDVIQERVNPELVAGMRIFIDDEREFDSSLKGKLDTIFQ
jgi:F0F1-type ATP synthase delta subunit